MSSELWVGGRVRREEVRREEGEEGRRERRGGG